MFKGKGKRGSKQDLVIESDSEIDTDVEKPKKPRPLRSRSSMTFARLFSRTSMEAGEDLKSDVLHTMTWSQPRVVGVGPTARYGHTMSVMGTKLLVFGGTDGSRVFDSLYEYETETHAWSLPSCSGTIPKPRHSHCAASLPNATLMVFGGIGGGNELYMLETMSMTWFVAKAAGSAPSPRFGLSAVLVDQSVLFLGGHDGNRGLDEIHELDLSTMTWSIPNTSGKIPKLGARHVAMGFPGSSKVYIIGGQEKGFSEISMYSHDSKLWTTMPGDGVIPQQRTQHSIAFLDRAFLLFGGSSGGTVLNDVFVLSSNSNSWHRSDASGLPPQPRKDHAICSVHNSHGTCVFVFGGHDGLKPLEDMNVLVTLTWNSVDRPENAPWARVGHTLSVVGDLMYMIGGAAEEICYNDCRIYDFVREEWSVPSLSGEPPKALVAHSASVFGTEIFVLGGGDGKTEGNELHVLDTQMGTWERPLTEGTMPKARYGHQSVNCGQRMYVLGGYSIKIGYSNELYVLDTELMSWSTPYVNGLKPLGRVGHSLAAVGKNVFLYGGSQNGEIFGDVHVLDTVTMTWSIPQMSGDVYPAPRFNHTAGAAGTKIFYFGGEILANDNSRQISKKWRRHRGNLVIDELYALETRTMTWEIPRVAGKSPGARFRHGAAMWDTRMVIFGGDEGGEMLWSLVTGIQVDTSSIPKKKALQIMKTEDMDAETISLLEWLRDIGLEKYSRSFVKAEIDWDSLVELDDNDLRLMGITAVGPRKKLLATLGRMREERSKNDKESFVASDLFAGRYRLEGATDFGTSAVKLALDIKTDKRVALKFVSDVSAFRNEVTMLNNLRSEFVVDMLDFIEDQTGKSHCIVLEYASMNLAQYLRTNKLEKNERKYIIDRLARMLEHLHSKNIVHGDYKPANVCLFGIKWKLIDLMTARYAGDPVASASTPLYCSPEYAKAVSSNSLGRLAATPTMDVWALGIILAETFTRRHFLRSDKTDIMTILLSFNEIDIPRDTIDDTQAVYLLSKIFKKNHMDRCNINAILRSAFLVGGLDTQQLENSFSFMAQTQRKLHDDLSRITESLSAQKDIEIEYMSEIEKQKALKSELEELTKSR